MRKPNRKTLIRKLQEAVNLYARLRDCAERGGCNCISCNQWKYFDDLDGGHFVKSTSSEVRFDLRNINAQCQQCNRYLGGNERNYYDGMRKKWGQDVIDELQSKQYNVKKWSVDELQEMLENVEKMNSELQ
jgi:hypothetical protein